MHPDDRFDSRTGDERHASSAGPRTPKRGGGRRESGASRVPAFDFGGTAGAHSHRLAQVNSLIARVLRDRLARGVNDPRVQGMVSVLAVECTPDFHIAHVRISVLPGDRARLTLSGLRSATRHLEGVVRKETRLRKVPRLLFELDDSIKREAALSESLHRAQGTLPGDPGDRGAPLAADAVTDNTGHDPPAATA